MTANQDRGMVFTAKRLYRVLRLTREEMADLLNVSRRSVGYALQGRRELPARCGKVVEELSHAISSASKNLENALPLIPDPKITSAMSASLGDKQFSKTDELERLRLKLRLAEREYQQCTRSRLILEQLSCKLPDPQSQVFWVVLKKKSIAQSRKSEREYHPAKQWELKIRIAGLEAELKVIEEGLACLR